MSVFRLCLSVLITFCFYSLSIAADSPPLQVEGANAVNEASMKTYVELIEHTSIKIKMLPINGGEFLMGSPATEAKRKSDEGPQRRVKIDPFWMAETETTWDAFDVWAYDQDIQALKEKKTKPSPRDASAEQYQLTQPSPPYLVMDFGMGRRGFPAINMTQLAARTYCQWLSEKTGRYYRLPTEAEWEYACRAGTTTAYSWGDDPKELDAYAWSYTNSSEKYQKVAQKKPNPWGLFDMHGNVSEWVLDQYDPVGYLRDNAGVVDDNPLTVPRSLYPRVVRGGSYDEDPEGLRSAARGKSDRSWKRQDPEIPKSIWWHNSAPFFGFRIVRPLKRPTEAEIKRKWGNHGPFQNPAEDLLGNRAELRKRSAQ